MTGLLAELIHAELHFTFSFIQLTQVQQTALQEHQLYTNNYYKMTELVDNVYVLHKNMIDDTQVITVRGYD